jgi:hypothetical protein
MKATTQIETSPLSAHASPALTVTVDRKEVEDPAAWRSLLTILSDLLAYPTLGHCDHR